MYVFPEKMTSKLVRAFVSAISSNNALTEPPTYAKAYVKVPDVGLNECK